MSSICIIVVDICCYLYTRSKIFCKLIYGEYTYLLIHFFFFNTVTMTIQRPVFSENDRLNLKLYISWHPYARIQLIYFEIAIVWCRKQCLFFLRLFSEPFLLPVKIHWDKKTCQKLLFELSLTSQLNETNLENLRHSFVTIPLLFQTHYSLSICC